MTNTEASTRIAAAVTRLGKVYPFGPTVYLAVWFAKICIQWALTILAAFAVCRTLGISLLWGLPLGVVASYAVGFVWDRVTRTRRVLAIEAAADAAEKG